MKKYPFIFAILTVFQMPIFNSCVSPKATEVVNYQAPTWSKNSVIYEVNTRQYNNEGTFKAVESDLPRIKNLGVDILWFMPIHPIGKLNRKGTLGSYYSVKDYKSINPEFGSLDNFKSLVKKAHEQGLKVIIDWVPNHTAWDHEWITKHPDWYVHDSTGKIITQYDWSDVAKLNYSNKDLRIAMIEAMKYWLTECDIDGFRCDVAFLVPADFWKEARVELEKAKPVFMLAEMEAQKDINPNPREFFENAFNANYNWSLHSLGAEIAQGKKPISDLLRHLETSYKETPTDVYRMSFLTNHDENSWNGTVDEKYGQKWKAFSILNYTLPQTFPLIYSGEEANLKKRLQFFEKDPINWNDTTLYSWYRKMNAFKHSHSVVNNGNQGGDFNVINQFQLNGTEDVKSLFAFSRKNSTETLYVVCNLTSGDQSFETLGNYIPKNENLILQSEFKITPPESKSTNPLWLIPANGFLVFSVKN